MQSQQYEIHPAATLFPMMTEEEYQGLKQDIKENGQREYITVWCNKIIDGRNRLRACQELGIDPDVAELDEEIDPWKYVISHNLHRRHLTTSQRAMVATNLATLKNGQHKKDAVQNCTASLDDAANQLKVSRRTVAHGKKVQEFGHKDLIQAVEQGKVPVSLAAKLVAAVPDKEEQKAVLDKGIDEIKKTVGDKKKTKKPKQEQPQPEPPKQEKPKAKQSSSGPIAKVKAYFDSIATADKIAVLSFVECCEEAGALDMMPAVMKMWAGWCDAS